MLLLFKTEIKVVTYGVTNLKDKIDCNILPQIFFSVVDLILWNTVQRIYEQNVKQIKIIHFQ